MRTVPPPRPPRRAPSRALLLTLACTGALPAQEGIRVARVPATLSLPAPEGRNLLLEVELSGAPTDVWLQAGSSTGHGTRVPLEPAGNGRWQLNLADRRVGRLALFSPTNELRVCAEVAGRRVQSAPIAFARSAVADARVRCRAHLAKVAEPVEMPQTDTGWLDPAAVERLVVTTDATDAMVLAQMGGTDRPLVPDPARGTFTLTVDEGLRAAWRQAQRLELVVQRGQDLAAVCAIEAIPRELDVPPEGARFTIPQRSEAPLPGARKWLRVEIDDITAGQVQLTVRAAGGPLLVDRVSVRERDRVPLRVGGRDYAIVVEKLENLLIGEDWAELRVLAAEGLGRDRIAELLECIRSAKVTFVRNGSEFGGEAAAIHVRKKLAALGREPTIVEFVDRVASQSSTTGEDYIVKLEDGTTALMRVWLQQQLARLDAAAARGGSGR